MITYMSKDDYIRFRCSSDLKRLAEKNAKERGLSLTDYMDYLIRKDREGMMYLFDCEDIENELRKKIINNGLAVTFNEARLLAKVSELSIDGQVIKSDIDLEEYIQYYDDGGYVELIEGFQVGQSDAINVLLGDLYEPDDEGLTCAEKIYNSENPSEEILKLINEYLLIAINFKLTDINCSIRNLENRIENGENIWE